MYIRFHLPRLSHASLQDLARLCSITRCDAITTGWMLDVLQNEVERRKSNELIEPCPLIFAPFDDLDGDKLGNAMLTTSFWTYHARDVQAGALADTVYRRVLMQGAVRLALRDPAPEPEEVATL